jgi:hypothetical protein
MFELQPGYLKVIRDNGFQVPADYPTYAAQFAAIREALAADAPPFRAAAASWPPTSSRTATGSG